MPTVEFPNGLLVRLPPRDWTTCKANSYPFLQRDYLLGALIPIYPPQVPAASCRGPTRSTSAQDTPDSSTRCSTTPTSQSRLCAGRRASGLGRPSRSMPAACPHSECAIDPTEGFKNEAGESMHGNCLARAFAHLWLCGKLKCVWTELKSKQSKEHKPSKQPRRNKPGEPIPPPAAQAQIESLSQRSCSRRMLSLGGYGLLLAHVPHHAAADAEEQTA